MARVLVVSHPAVLAANQGTYAALADLGWEVRLIVPGLWVHEYDGRRFPPEVMPELAEVTRAVPVVAPGAPQRHLYLRRPSALLANAAPDVVFIEEEPYSLCAGQWRGALVRCNIPYGVQADENLDRPLPRVAKVIRRRVLSEVSFVAARSRRAGDLIRTFAPSGLDVAFVPHTILSWEVPPAPPRPPSSPFVVGFAGRFLPEKGLHDLLEATTRMRTPVRLKLFGDGPMREELVAASRPERPVEVLTGVRHEDMGDAYASLDVLVLPSRTTTTWSEQYGRVLVESMSCGRPVVGSDSGEIPWVIGETGGGVVFPEGDTDALARTLDSLAEDDARRLALGETGRAGVEQRFTASAAARALSALLTRARSSSQAPA